MNETLKAEFDWRVRVFDSLSFPTLIMKPDKTIISANRIFLEKYGVTMDQVLNKTCHQVFYGADFCPEISCPLSRVLLDKRGHVITRRVFTRTEKQLWEDRVFSPILDEAGEIAYIMESVRDITRLKTLEKSLKETKEFLEKLIQSSPVAIVAADRYPALAAIVRAARIQPAPDFAQALIQTAMPCGVGACEVCRIPTRAGEKHVCADGPVFDILTL